MSRYIDADKLIKSIPFYNGDYPVMMKAVWAAIDATPTADVVAVVRCKDCKHGQRNGSGELIGHYICEYDQYGCLKHPRHYCGHGERREE